MKSYTDLEQSKKLAKILPVETADMCYRIVAHNPNDTHEYQPYCFVGTLESDIPCWSLAALLDILRNRASSIDEDADVSLSSYKNVEWWDLSINNSGLEAVTKSDIVDACVEMIFTVMIFTLKGNNLI